MSLDDFLHRCDCNRPERCPYCIVDFIQHFIQSGDLWHSGSRRGHAFGTIGLLEMPNEIEKRETPDTAGELIAAAGATDGPDEAGTRQVAHYLRQMMARHIVFLSNGSNGSLAAFAGREFEYGHDGQQS
jgi:hypothetical protein